MNIYVYTFILFLVIFISSSIQNTKNEGKCEKYKNNQKPAKKQCAPYGSLYTTESLILISSSTEKIYNRSKITKDMRKNGKNIRIAENLPKSSLTAMNVL